MAVSLYLVWTRRRILATTPAPRNLAFLLLVLALAIHLWAMPWRAYYISALMIPLALFGLIVALSGWRIAQRFAFPLAFLVLMVPLPIAERVEPMLEGWAALSATTLAQWLGVAAQSAGSQVFLPNSTFTVGIPCGGLRSLIAIITLATLFAYIVQGAWWMRALILLAAVPIVLAANTLRIALIFVVANAWGAAAAMDYFYNLSSPVLFLASFALLVGLGKIARCDQVRWEAILPA